VKYYYTIILAVLILAISILAFSAKPQAGLNIKEADVEKYSSSFDQQALQKILSDYNNLNDKSKLKPTDYYLLARTCEGLLSYYEAYDNEQEVTKIALLGTELAQKAIELDNTLSDAHRVLSRFLAKQLNWGNIYQLGPKVLDELDRAVKTDPHNYRATLGKVVVYLYAPPMFGGNVDLAIQKLNEFTDKYPAFEDGFLNLGIAYKVKGNTIKAKEIFESVLSRNPSNLTAKKELKIMNTSKP